MKTQRNIFIKNMFFPLIPRYISKDNVSTIKGVAVLLLLCHHLFSCMPDNISVIFPPWVICLGQLSKVCVHIFLIVSGYGLIFSAQKSGNIWNFYKRRILKIFPLFWTIAFMGIAVSWFIFGLSPDVVYHSVTIKGHLLNPYFCLLIQFGGMQDLFHFYGYNPTWWFMTLILLCYVIFPFLYEVVKKYPIITFLGITFLCESHMLVLKGVGQWLIPFTLGMGMGVLHLSHNPISESHKKIVTLGGGTIYAIIMLLIIGSLLGDFRYLRMTRDTLLAFSIIGLICFAGCSKFLCFLGRYSYGIFLCHTFIYAYWAKKFVYFFHNPIWSLSVLLILSLLWAIIADYIQANLVKFFTKTYKTQKEL